MFSLPQMFLGSATWWATCVTAFQPAAATTLRQTTAVFASEEENISANQQRRALLLSVASVALFAPLNVWADDEEEKEPAPASAVVLHIVDYPKSGSCGQANDVPSNGVFFAKKFGGLVDGSCATEGYSIAEGTANGLNEKDQQRTYEIYGKE